MNNEINSSLFNLNDNAKNNNIDDTSFYKKFSKKDKKNKIDQFVKFKPKNIPKKKGEPSLKGAENKVKSILSSFLQTMKNEEKKEKINNRDPGIKILISKLAPKKVKTNNDKKEKWQIKNSFNPDENSNLSALNKFYINNVKNKERENSSFKITSDDINEKRTNQKKKYLKTKKYFSMSKLNINYKNSKTTEDDYENFKSEKAKNNNIRYNTGSNFKSNISTSNFHSMVKSDISTRVNDNLISSSGLNDNNKNYFDKKKKFLKANSVNVLNIFQKKFILGDNDISKKKISNKSAQYMSSKNILYEPEKKYNKIKKRKSFFAKKNENKYNNIFLLEASKNNEIINNNKILGKKYSSKKRFNSIKEINEEYNISNRMVNKLASIVENPKKKSIHYTKKDLLNDDPKNKLRKVETVLKNLQEKLKHSLIIGPEEIDLNNNETPQRKRTKKNKEKRTSKKILSSNKNLTNRKNSNNFLEDKDLLNNGKNPNLYDDDWDKNKLQLPKSDLFKVNSSVSKNETELEALKSVEQDYTSNQLPFVRNNSQIDIALEKYRVLTHKKLVYDSLDDEEIEDEINDFFYINPESKFVIIFDGILLLITLYSIFDFPYYLAHSLTFCKNGIFSFERCLNIFIEIIYFFDLIFGFFRAYYNFEEILIKKNSSIIKKYLNSWFIFDLVGAIPFYSIIKIKEEACTYSFRAEYYNHKLNNTNYLFLCNRLLKMVKSITNNQAYNYIINILNGNKYYNQISLFLNICFILLIFHLTSCIYIFIGRNSYPNWILSTNLDNKSFYHIYICGIYILITALTTVGYGDITCYSFKERIFQLILLIIGIVAYSWIISSFSNYVKKINEQSVDLESRISILDDIKMTNPNMTKDLYDRILRHLKYKKYFEKKDKSVILDSLPVTLKNNLIVEMYKPIIKNFIFFKSFQNTDFIVRVILSFKPILALKNDILVNEGDIVEDIMFVKKGILSVELPLNMENPEENIKHYLNMPILQIENDLGIVKVGGNPLESQKGILFRSFDNVLRTTLSKTDGENLNTKNISYVRILNIRENEHFGDVLMFLEQRSPLRVRVRTKKAELFFLKKIEAVKISSSYQNIWRRINKKSVFNFEQIKKSIIKMVVFYSSYKKIQYEVKEKDKKKNNKMNKSMHSFNFGVSKNIFETLREINIKRINSQKDLNVKNKYSELFEEDEKSEKSSRHKFQSSQSLNLTNSLYSNYDSLIDSDLSFKINKKNIKSNKMSLFQNTFKKSNMSSQNSFLKNKSIQESNSRDFLLINNNMNTLPEDENIIYHQQNNGNIRTFMTQHTNIKKDYLKENEDDNEVKSKKDSKKNIRLKTLSKSSKTYKESKSYLLSQKILDNKSKDSLSNKSSNKESEVSKNSYFIGLKINEEIYPDEECNIPIREEMLLNKKINLSKIDNKSKINNLNDNKNNHENSKVKLLLDYSVNLSNTNDLEKNNEKNEKQNLDKKKNQLHFNLCENKKEIEEKNIYEDYKEKALSIGKEISIEIPSLYENIYKLSNYKYYKDTKLQNKVKDIIKYENKSHVYSSLSSDRLNANLLQSNTRIDNPSSLKSRKTISSINSPSNLRRGSFLLSHNLNNSGLINKKKANDIKKRRNFFIKKDNYKDKFHSELYHSPSFNNRQASRISLTKINNNNNLNMIINSNKLKPDMKKKSINDSFLGTKSNTNLNGEINKMILNRNEETIHKKRRASLINAINFNIEKTNQNLNNPDEFYSNYFQLLLEEKNKNNVKDNKNLLSSIKINPQKNRKKKKKIEDLKKDQQIG